MLRLRRAFFCLACGVAGEHGTSRLAVRAKVNRDSHNRMERDNVSRVRLAMPNFFFNVFKDQAGKIIDAEGTELTDIRAAITFAVLSARSHAADDVLRGRFNLQDRIEITDSAGTLLHTVGFDEAVGLCS
jgi:hypothetical protein